MITFLCFVFYVHEIITNASFGVRIYFVLLNNKYARTEGKDTNKYWIMDIFGNKK